MYTQDQLKELVAKKAVMEFVRSNMVVGLGTGSTAKFVVSEIGRKLKAGELVNVKGVPTSNVTRDLAVENGIELLAELPEKLDLTIDGADRINLQTGDCLKGWGGAHYIEKRIARLGSRLVIIVDESKLCTSFVGERIPLEVVPSQLQELKNVLAEESLKFEVRDFISDSGNNVVDVLMPVQTLLIDFHDHMLTLPGVLDTGIFTGIATNVVVAKSSGDIDLIKL